MSENVTHTGVLDDCFRLMLVSEEICDAFKEVARSQNDFARLGGITRSGDRFTVQLLTDFRKRWASRKPEDKLEPKLAFVLGWLTHRAADRQMKPVFREAEPDRTQSPSDCSVYHDAFVFNEVFAVGNYTPVAFQNEHQIISKSEFFRKWFSVFLNTFRRYLSQPGKLPKMRRKDYLRFCFLQNIRIFRNSIDAVGV